jgi:hypothetical protein
MDAAFSKAANPRLPKVLGFKLQPLTLGHRLVLAKHGCAYVTEEAATLEDLMLAVFVCAQHFKAADRAISSWFFLRFVWLWSWFIAFRKLIVPIEHNKFRLYWDDGHACPEVDSSGKSSEISSPYEQRVLTMLISDFHMTREQAMEITLAEANAMWAAQGERKGVVELQSDRVRQLREVARQRDIEKFGKEKAA